MSAWNVMTYEGRDTLLRVLRQEAEVLTAFGRCNAGTVRGDAELADRFLNLFFRI